MDEAIMSATESTIIDKSANLSGPKHSFRGDAHASTRGLQGCKAELACSTGAI